MSTPSPTPPPVERIKAVNHHLRLALDQISEAVFFLQNGLSEDGSPVIAWGNAPAVRSAGLMADELFGAPLQPLLTPQSWQALQAALPAVEEGAAGSFDLEFPSSGRGLQAGLLKATLGAGREVLGYILTIAPAPAPAAAPAEDPPSSGKTGIAVPKQKTGDEPEAPPSPEGWQEDVIETIRETARQVAHEFNNALTSIRLPVELAIRAAPREGELFERLEVAHVSAQRASDLAKDFLDCFRPRSAIRGLCSPGELLGRAIRLATCAQNVSATLDLQGELPQIEVDESQLERVIFNLIRNSCQAMANGGRIRVAALCRTIAEEDPTGLPPGPWIQISVRDWGPGIPEEHLQHLFHSRFTTKPDGNGCGLPICHQIIKDHGGDMRVRSRVNVGTEFLIFLPAAAVVDEIPETTAPVPPAEPESLAEPSDPGNSKSASAPAEPATSPGPAASSPIPPVPAAETAATGPVEAEAASDSSPTPLFHSLRPLTSPVRLPEAPPIGPVPSAENSPPTPPPLPLSSHSPRVPAFPWVDQFRPEGSTSGVQGEAPALDPLVPPLPPETPASGITDTSPFGPPPGAGQEVESDAPPTLLVVDDEQGVRTALSQIARAMGYEVNTVANSDEALQTYRDRLRADRPYSTVLLDLNLRSGLNGMEVFQAIRRMDPEALVVATSGQHAEGDLERFRSLGFAGFLPKPYSLEHFDNVMRAALAS